MPAHLVDRAPKEQLLQEAKKRKETLVLFARSRATNLSPSRSPFTIEAESNAEETVQPVEQTSSEAPVLVHHHELLVQMSPYGRPVGAIT